MHFNTKVYTSLPVLFFKFCGVCFLCGPVFVCLWQVLKKAVIVRKRKVMEHTLTERSVLEAIRDFPFLVTLHYAFQTDTKLHLIMGECVCG